MEPKLIEKYFVENLIKIVPILLVVIIFTQLLYSKQSEQVLFENNENLRTIISDTEKELNPLKNVSGIFMEKDRDYEKESLLFDKYLPQGGIKVVAVELENDNQTARQNFKKIITTIALNFENIKPYILTYHEHKGETLTNSIIVDDVNIQKSPALFVLNNKNKVLSIYYFNGREGTAELNLISKYFLNLLDTVLKI